MKLYFTLILFFFSIILIFAQTSFMTGDIAVVGINANNTTACGDSAGTDIVSFVCFKDFTTGTTLDITDNGYERRFPGLWGDTEGTYRATRTGGTILAGTVITFRIKSGAFSCIYPDANFTFNSINGGWNSFNLNSGGDQIYFMQGGIWSGHTDTIAHNASYLGGNILFGFNTKTVWNSFFLSTQHSGLYPNMSCFSMTPTSGTDYVKYTGSMSATTQKDWILRISTQANWTKYTTCALYNSALPDYSAGIIFGITDFFNVDAGVNDTACQNQTVFALGGTPSGGYWTGIGITDTTAGLFDPITSGAGNFYVTYIYNDAGCLYHDLKTVVIRPKPVITINPGSGEACAGENFNITSSITAGTPPFTQLWTGDTAYLSSTSILNPVFNSSFSGNYNLTLTVTDSKGCIGANSKLIHVNSNPTATISPASLQECANADTNLIATPSGGSLTYSTHLWTGNTSILTGLINQPNVNVNSGTAGSYNLTYTVTDSKGCEGNSSISVTINPNPIVSIAPISQTICSGTAPNIGLSSNVTGTIFSWTVVQSGVSGASAGSGTPIAQTITNPGSTAGTATYTITPIANTCVGAVGSVIVTVNPLPVVTINPTSQSICSGNATSLSLSSNVTGTTYAWTVTQSGVAGASAGTGTLIAQALTYSGSPSTATYSVLGTASSCGGSATNVTVTVNPLPSITSALKTDVTICGGSDGTLTIVAAGTAPFSYSIDGGITFFTNGGSFTGLTAGNYPVAVKNANDCIVYGAILVISAGGAPPVPIAGTNAIYCQGQTAVSLTASIGSGGTITWFSNSGLTTQIGTGTSLNPNPYLIIGTNNFYATETVSGCSSTAATVTIIINAIPIVSATPLIQSFCSGGATNITLASSVSGTTFSWIVSQTGVTGASDGSGVNIAQTLTNSGFASGTAVYTITGTANSCSGDTDIVITVNPLPAITSASKTDVILCGGNDGTISIIATGAAPLTYSIDGGLTFLSNSGSFTGLTAGNYQVVVKNSFGCDVTGATLIIGGGGAPSAPTTGENADYCQGETAVSLVVSAGSGGTLTWYSDLGLTIQIGTGASLNPNPYLVTGTNNFYATETVNSCRSNPAIVTIIINALPVPGVTVTANILCFGENTGSAIASANGGNAPYTYLWQNNVNTPTITGLSANIYYHVTVTDSLSCSAIDSIQLIQPSALLSVINASSVKCKGNSDGTAFAAVTGGTLPYSYLWSNSTVGSSINDVPAGVFTITITDNNNCTTSNSIVITEPAFNLSLNVTPVNGNCGGSNNGSIYTVTSGGTPPYSFYWSNNQTDSIIINLASGTYHVTVSDFNDCQNTSSAIITIPNTILATIDTTKNITSCQDNDDGSLLITVSGGVNPYTYLWSNGSTNKDITNLTKGEYTITITDSLSCSVSKIFEIKSMSGECLEITTAFTPNGDGNNDTWEIKRIGLYPKVRVEIYNRWGNMIFISNGYSQFWDGKYNGVDVTSGSYIYIINLNNGSEVYKGTITVIR